MHILTEHRRHRSDRRRGNQAPSRSRPGDSLRAFERTPRAGAVALREELYRPDRAARRVREAGGPKDHACYSCSCGLIFDAAVSTSVACPHCGVTQAW